MSKREEKIRIEEMARIINMARIEMELKLYHAETMFKLRELNIEEYKLTNALRVMLSNIGCDQKEAIRCCLESIQYNGWTEGAKIKA